MRYDAMRCDAMSVEWGVQAYEEEAHDSEDEVDDRPKLDLPAVAMDTDKAFDRAPAARPLSAGLRSCSGGGAIQGHWVRL